ncbi:MAG: hypothetical protein RIR43_532 [Pseudomonadota bacterium]|jgi:UPF0042 nucleotide-binding protein
MMNRHGAPGNRPTDASATRGSGRAAPSRLPDELVLITGISGSGKTVAMNALEDAGYFCVDNLPPELLRAFLDLERTQHRSRLAVAVDVRSTGSPSVLAGLIRQLTHEGVKLRVIFLESATDILVRRFSESRRPHPLTGHAGEPGDATVLDRRALTEAISLEREMMADIRDLATVLDSSEQRPAQLRAAVRDLLGIPYGQLTLVFESFAYKHGVPLDADFVFDVRVLPNPYYLQDLRSQTGRDTGVMDYLKGQPEAQQMIHHISAFIHRWLEDFKHDQRSYLTVAIGCTGGQHRSVYIAEQLAGVFGSSVVTLLRHRELDGRALP